MTDVNPTNSKTFWDGVWSKEENRDFWTQADPVVAQLAATISPQDHPDVLDLGCGLGRHAIVFAQVGHTVTAVDLSESALAYVQTRVDELGLSIHTQIGQFSDDLFAPESFDLVLAVNVLYHGLPTDFTRTIIHIHSWLRSHGLFYFTCPTLEDGEYGRGTEVAPQTFEFECGHIHYNASWADLEPLLNRFRLVSRKKREHEWKKDGARQFSSRWQVLVEKP